MRAYTESFAQYVEMFPGTLIFVPDQSRLCYQAYFSSASDLHMTQMRAFMTFCANLIKKGTDERLVSPSWPQLNQKPHIPSNIVRLPSYPDCIRLRINDRWSIHITSFQRYCMQHRRDGKNKQAGKESRNARRLRENHCVRKSLVR